MKINFQPAAVSRQPEVITAISLSLIAWLSLSLLPGCENTPTEAQDYKSEAVLTAFLFNGEPVDEVHLERVAPIYGDYDPKQHGITGAGVMIYELGGGDTLHLVDDPAYPGRYVPSAGDSLIPRGMTRYRIEARTPQGEFLWSEALVPGGMTAHDSVHVFQLYPDSIHVIHEGDTLNRRMPPIQLVWGDVDSAGGYEGVGIALTGREDLIPLDPDWTPADSIDEIARGRAGWMGFREDQRATTLLWVLFTWVGPHRLEMRAVSREFADYLFSMQRVEQGLATEPTCNIRGGRGIFGALSRWQMNVYMERVGN